MRQKINKLTCKECGQLFETTKRSDTKHCSRRCYLDDHNKSRKGRTEYYHQNKDRIRAKINERYSKIKETSEFKEKQRIYAAKYEKERKAKDLNYKLRKQLRSRLATAITIDQKTGSAVSDLGCSIEDFKIYIESLWEPGMTWNNWSLRGWHLDHIKPLCEFDLTDYEQFKIACRYTNIQPMWREDHLLKTAADLSRHNSSPT